MARKIKITQAKNIKKVKASPRATSKEPQTMEELLSLYGTKASLSVGDRVKGRIVSMEPGRMLVDIGGKSEGLLAEKAYKEAEGYIKTLKIGDEVDARVIVPETSDGYTILTLREAVESVYWGNIEKLQESATPVKVEGKGVNPSGVMVDVLGMSGFIPLSQLGKESLKNSQALIGKRFEAIVIDFEKQSKKVILSEKEVSEKDELQKTRKALKEIKEGDIYEGKVSTIYDFGCFVRIEVGKDKLPLEGLVHISEIAWEKVDNPGDLVSEGDEVKVKVIGIKNEKLAFSIKQALKDPWIEADKKYEIDDKVKGKVIRVSDFGLFIQLEPGVEGLLHITKIPPGKNLSRGDEVNVSIEEVDAENRKIALGLVLTEKPVGYK
ncbi:MAG: RNA binding S1 domain protein [Microgenomates group bacterium GW2011_GWC1_37_8]|uniref:S1 motif domain-containing protein n=1 Tax=Candidatus Woesebacteria bacterium RIFCSPHIGHO2_01_FULL_38_9b TaxID=1802493 RepID=A0A1F7Y3S0_9BACT|nr:MAG: RNA binding S1 domain protein [Microgenomates group bacterium GW2011_GWC1_37_8]OGM21926.1 MAG: hypothetical protein A2863_03430 [Candidatus Woesebacteria bacterium RIFCSPHIGHO2_01_FULL_38_9b]